MANKVDIYFNLIASSADLNLKAAEAKASLNRLGGAHDAVGMSQNRMMGTTAKMSRGLGTLGYAFSGVHSGAGMAVSGVLRLTSALDMLSTGGGLAIGGIAILITG